jgi:hypothetical protein
MKRMLTLAGLMAAVAVVANTPGPAPYSNRPHGEKVSLAAIAAIDVREIQQAAPAGHRARSDPDPWRGADHRRG